LFDGEELIHGLKVPLGVMEPARDTDDAAEMPEKVVNAGDGGPLNTLCPGRGGRATAVSYEEVVEIVSRESEYALESLMYGPAAPGGSGDGGTEEPLIEDLRRMEVFSERLFLLRDFS
jgi:hypothetical protein